MMIHESEQDSSIIILLFSIELLSDVQLENNEVLPMNHKMPNDMYQ
jgi:hypothetical protein